MTHSIAGHHFMTRVTRVTRVLAAWALLSGFCAAAFARAPLATVYVVSVQVPTVSKVIPEDYKKHRQIAEFNSPEEWQSRYDSSSLTRKNAKSWHEKVNYFVNLSREWRAIDVTRETLNSAVEQSRMDADYHSTTLSFTAGGNLLPSTVLYWDLTSEHYTLAGDLITTGVTGVENASALRFERYNLLTEWFVETDLSHGWSVGADFYHSRSRYRDSVTDEVFTDKAFGAGLSLSKKIVFATAQWRFDYVLSHRLLTPGDSSFSDESRTFHNLISAYEHRWNFDWHTQFSVRGAYYPEVDRTSFWEATQVYAAGAEVNYFPQTGHQLSLKAEQTWLGSEDTLSTLLLNYEYQFGLSQTKRRKRHRRIPQLLIR